MTTDTEDLLWRRFNEWFRARRPDYPSEWDAYQAGHAAAKAEHADVGEPAAWMAVLTHPRSQGPQAHFVSDAKLARQWDYNGVVDGEPCIVQPLFTAHQLAAAVAQEALRREAGGEGMKPTTEPCGHGQLYSGPCVDCEIDWLHEQHRHAARTIARVRNKLRELGAPMPGFTSGGRRADQA